jgi:DNA-binding CsgD family transcriptional regulator
MAEADPPATEHPCRPRSSLAAPPGASETTVAYRDSGTEVVGRRRERRTLDRLLAALQEGSGGALVVRGEAGTGKTALLEHARRRASGCRVADIVAVPSEMDLACGALHQLCLPLLDRMERLPDPQRSAIDTAFRRTPGMAPDRLSLAVAVLSLLSETAEEEDRPLVCVVDDAQWLDATSSSVLGFVARRLATQPIVLLFAARAPVPALAGLPELPVRGLAEGEARALLLSALRGPLDERVTGRLIAEAEGNPLALLEVPRAATAGQLAGGFGEPDAGILLSPTAGDLAQDLEALTSETRLLLLVAAADPLGEPLLLWRAADALRIPSGAADAAKDAGLLDIGTRVRFRNPMARAVVYRSAHHADRRMVHRALATASDARSDPERRAWHRARGASAPDEHIAAELEDSAGRAAARGGLAAAAAFLQQATVLTPEPADRARRALDAAEAERQAGDPEAALELVVAAEVEPLDALGRARAELLRARIASAAGADDAAALLFAVGRRLELLDVDQAREAYLDALGATIWRGPQPGCDPIDVARAAGAVRSAAPPDPSDLLLDGLALQLTEGDAAAAPALGRALAALTDDRLPADGALDRGWLASYVAGALWESDAQRALTERHVELARGAGALAVLPLALVQLTAVYLREGRLARAAELLSQAEAAAEATHTESPTPVGTLLAACRGREAEGRRLIEEARQELRPRTRGLGAALVQLAGLVLNNGLGRYHEALEEGRDALHDAEPVVRPAWALVELVEAATRAGALDVAAAAMDRLSERARICGTEWALGLEARARALLSDAAEAERLYREAVTRLDCPATPVDCARARLLYGEWLRRAGRRVDARRQLRIAHATLSDLGFEAFAERAQRELQATGETTRRRTTDTRDELTPQELEIARLAGDGLSNPEIGARLFLSPRTVEWHLRKVFAKLAIRSRRELTGALPSSDAELIGA